jgi:hypothetical protein
MEMKRFYDLLQSDESANQNRSVGKYFRIGYYGPEFAEYDGCEFIVKQPPFTHLFALAESLKVSDG